MLKERSAGVVIFRRNGEEKYLLLHYEAGHWDFVKGNVERGEGELGCVVRETEEETGIKDLRFFQDFREEIRYFYKRGGNLVDKKVVFYLAETQTPKIKLSYEHIGFEWLRFEDAYKRLTFKNAKEVLRSARDFLLKNGKSYQSSFLNYKNSSNDL